MGSLYAIDFNRMGGKGWQIWIILIDEFSNQYAKPFFGYFGASKSRVYLKEFFSNQLYKFRSLPAENVRGWVKVQIRSSKRFNRFMESRSNKKSNE